MYYRIYRNKNKVSVHKGVRYEKASVKIVESNDGFHVIVRYFIFKKIPFFVNNERFDSAEDADHRYEFLKNFLRKKFILIPGVF